MTIEELEGLTEYLAQFITENKRSKIETALLYRTRHFAVVLEDIYQPHNASAVLRTCECLGIQDVHVIESRNRYRPNPDVVMGSNKWLDLYHHGTAIETDAETNSSTCMDSLRSQGYQIVATSPHGNPVQLADFPLKQKSAFVFGSEEPGLSQTILENADMAISLPMFGFTESYNISVCVAIAMARLVERLHQSKLAWQLTEYERSELRLKWYRRIIKRHDLLEKQYNANSIA